MAASTRIGENRKGASELISFLARWQSEGIRSVELELEKARSAVQAFVSKKTFAI